MKRIEEECGRCGEPRGKHAWNAGCRFLGEEEAVGKSVLSDSERKLLDALVYGDVPDWWKVIPSVEIRNAAIHRLKDLGLLEIRRSDSMMRATPKGRLSNRLWRKSFMGGAV